MTKAIIWTDAAAIILFLLVLAYCLMKAASDADDREAEILEKGEWYGKD